MTTVKVNAYLLRSTIVAALGGLLFGFDTAVISGDTDALKIVFGLGDAWLGLPGTFWQGFTVASALIGTIVGSIAVGRPADTFGRRSALLTIAVLYFVSALGSALPWNWASFVSFRFIGGLAIGGASVVSPMYIAEISPAKLRGRLVAVTQFNIVAGILLAFFSNYLIAWLHLGANEWRWMFGVVAVPSAAFFFLLFLTPNSPRWLVARGRVEEARKIFRRLGAGDVDEEIGEIRASLDVAHHGVEEPFFRKAYLRPILLAVA
ncbi:MAG: MFS transporter, partial [Thermoguttaceae bacterium]